MDGGASVMSAGDHIAQAPLFRRPSATVTRTRGADRRLMMERESSIPPCLSVGSAGHSEQVRGPEKALDQACSARRCGKPVNGSPSPVERRCSERRSRAIGLPQGHRSLRPPSPPGLQSADSVDLVTDNAALVLPVTGGPCAAEASGPAGALRRLQGPLDHACSGGRAVGGLSFASFRRFWAAAARRNSSRAPHGPRKRSRPSFRMRLRWAKSISTFFRSRRVVS